MIPVAETVSAALAAAPGIVITARQGELTMAVDPQALPGLADRATYGHGARQMYLFSTDDRQESRRVCLNKQW